MMKNRNSGWVIAACAIFAAVAIAAARSAMANCGHCDGDKKEGGMTCPSHVKGAETKVTNTEDGVTISITARDKAVVKQIQEAAVHMGKGGHECKDCEAKAKGANKDGKKALYQCPMKGCYKGDNTKDGKCPHCGMKLEKVKP